MLPHQQRVVDEKYLLDDKIVKLKVFLTGPIFNKLPEKEQGLLTRQVAVMDEYTKILEERISSF